MGMLQILKKFGFTNPWVYPEREPEELKELEPRNETEYCILNGVSPDPDEFNRQPVVRGAADVSIPEFTISPYTPGSLEDFEAYADAIVEAFENHDGDYNDFVTTINNITGI